MKPDDVAVLIFVPVGLTVAFCAAHAFIDASATTERSAKLAEGADRLSVAIPPMPGARSFVAGSVIVSALLGGTVCFFIGAQPWAYVLVTLGACVVGSVAAKPSDISTTCIRLERPNHLQVTRGLLRRVVWSGPITSAERRSPVWVARRDEAEWIRWERRVWARISADEARLLQQWGLRLSKAPPQPQPRRTYLHALRAGALIALVLSALSVFVSLPVAENHLEGSFSADHTSVQNPAWVIRPSFCLYGKNQRTFDGVVLRFSDALKQLKLIRFDEHRSPDSVIDVEFIDEHRRSKHIHERDCRSVTGETRVAKTVHVDDRDLSFIEGEIQIDCPTIGLKGSARYSGCLP